MEVIKRLIDWLIRLLKRLFQRYPTMTLHIGPITPKGDQQ